MGGGRFVKAKVTGPNLFDHFLHPAFSTLPRPAAQKMARPHRPERVDHCGQIAGTFRRFGVGQRDACPGADGPAQNLLHFRKQHEWPGLPRPAFDGTTPRPVRVFHQRPDAAGRHHRHKQFFAVLVPLAVEGHNAAFAQQGLLNGFGNGPRPNEP